MNCSVKKRYTAPSLDSIAIDQEITLVMISDGGDPGWDAPSSRNTAVKKTKNTSPFGGTKPDYSNIQ